MKKRSLSLMIAALGLSGVLLAGCNFQGPNAVINQEAGTYEKQQLYHEGIELKNNQKIFDYNCFFNQNLILYLVLKLKIEIKIEFNQEKYITVYTKPNETIESIKKIIENKENYPSIYMDLIFKDQILENHKLISGHLLIIYF